MTCASKNSAKKPATRRDVIVAGMGLSAAALLPQLALANNLVVGFIYVGQRNDFGYNQSHARSAAQIKNLPNVRVIEQERVAESDEVESVMEAMIVQDGAKVIYPTSYGYYDPHVLRMARKYPDVIFRHCGGRWRDGDPANIGSYFGHMHEGQFLAGFVAGSMAKVGKVGFVASNRFPPVMRNLNAFALGVQQANKDATVQVLFTGSWSDPVREAESVNILADRGATVFGCSVDSARSVIETAKRRKLLACGYNASMARLGGDSYLTASISKWSAINLRTIKTVLDGGQPPNYFSGGLAEGLVDCDSPGPTVPGDVSSRLYEIRQSIITGGKWIWQGPLHAADGSLIVQKGERIGRDDPLLQKMDWFVRGVQG